MRLITEAEFSPFKRVLQAELGPNWLVEYDGRPLPETMTAGLGIVVNALVTYQGNTVVVGSILATLDLISPWVFAEGAVEQLHARFGRIIQ